MYKISIQIRALGNVKFDRDGKLIGGFSFKFICTSIHRILIQLFNAVHRCDLILC